MNEVNYQTGRKFGLYALAAMVGGGVIGLLARMVGLEDSAAIVLTGVVAWCGLVCGILAYVKSFGIGKCAKYSFRWFMALANGQSKNFKEANIKELSEFGWMWKKDYDRNELWVYLIYPVMAYVWLVFFIMLPFVMVGSARKGLIISGEYEF